MPLVFTCAYMPIYVQSLDHCAQVAYDHRAFTINNQRILLQSGSIHYPRSTPDMWPRLMQLARKHGLNTVETYAFWNVHEPVKGIWDFASPVANLTGWLSEAQSAGLFVIMRLGPYVCAEWNNGGIPAWTRNEPGIVYRSMNSAWRTLVTTFVTRVLREVEPYLARNGGPIVLTQIENEVRCVYLHAYVCLLVIVEWVFLCKSDARRALPCCVVFSVDARLAVVSLVFNRFTPEHCLISQLSQYGNVEAFYSDAAQYIAWNAQTANSFNVSVPWIMCVQDDAPASVVNTNNGFYSDGWVSKHASTQPKSWTENWPGAHSQRLLCGI